MKLQIAKKNTRATVESTFANLPLNIEAWSEKTSNSL